MATEIEIATKRRSTIRGSFTKLKGFIKSIDVSVVKLSELQFRLKYAETLFSEFKSVEDKIYRLNANDQSQYDSIEEIYYEVMSGLNECIRNISLNDSGGFGDPNQTDDKFEKSISAEVKIPGLKIPRFTGEYTDWQTFYQLFLASIHNNNKLHPVQKFQFLINSLSEEPARLLKHMDVTEANYILALNKLKERYDRKRHTVNKFIQMFNDQPIIHKAVAQNVRQMYDVTDEVIRALKGLGAEAESRDPWIIYALTNKLDEESRTLWLRHSARIDFPTISEFLEFLTDRADALEGNKTDDRKVTARPTSNSRSIKTHHISSSIPSTLNKCPVCKSNDHYTFQCNKFRQMTVPQRRDFLKAENRCFNCFGSNHSSNKCFSNKRCYHCQRTHHTLIHIVPSGGAQLSRSDEPRTMASSTNSTRDMASTKSNQGPEATIQSNTENRTVLTMDVHRLPTNSTIVLPTALIKVQNRIGEWHYCRALLDSGAESSFITERCIQTLGIPRRESKMIIRGLGQHKIGHTRGEARIKIKPYFESEFELCVDAYITTDVASTIPPVKVDITMIEALRNERIADPSPIHKAKVDVLIGVNHFWSLLRDGQIRENNKVVAQNSELGWIISGKFEKVKNEVTALNIDVQINQSLKRFWETEEIVRDVRDDEMAYSQQQCESQFLENCSRSSDGRYILRLPFQSDPSSLGGSFYIAKTRLLAMERKFRRNPEFGQKYKDFMNEYIHLGHMSKISDTPDENELYLPHHGVLRESSTSTKLRVVFDASARTSSGKSINEHLNIGFTVQQSLYHILVNFRQYRIAVGADIEKMYRQIWLHPEDRKFQRVLWREDPDKPIEVYELATLTYGMASAPFLATRTLKLIADSCISTSPRVANAIKDNMYVDDLLSGADSEEEAVSLCQEIRSIFLTSGMNLRKWRSNSKELIMRLCSKKQDLQLPVQFEDSSVATQTLGLQWTPDRDCFTYKVKLNNTSSTTKREILSEFSRIFDPLGLISPFTIRIKVMFQKLWQLKLEWDERLPDKLLAEWTALRNEISNLSILQIPRWVGPIDETTTLHGFSDASNEAYAATVYVCTNHQNVKMCRLVTAKTKVTPLEPVTIPRLELCGALLVAELLTQIANIWNINKGQLYAWTDSQIVLDWLADSPVRWKPFVANRTSKIRSMIPSAQWYHVPSNLNPADCATRGLNPHSLNKFDLWWNGPEYLRLTADNWPRRVTRETSKPLPEARRNASKILTLNVNKPSNSFIYELSDKFSSYIKFLMVLAYVYRAVNKFKRTDQHIGVGLTRNELNYAAEQVYKAIQKNHFEEDLRRLKAGKNVKSSSKLISFDPFIDTSGILRVGGRLENAPIDYTQKHPIVLTKQDPIVKRIIIYYHVKNFHCGIANLLHLIRQQFWIGDLKNTIRKVIHDCVPCTKERPKCITQKMGALPKSRVELIKPFARTGVDFAGPMNVLLIRGRGQKHYKCYICLFVCMCTKAGHIELAQNLSTESFLGALNRFVARRGCGTDIYSDNGSNFRGAKKKIDELNSFLQENTDQLSSQVLKQHQITWHFIPVHAPHVGGLWEAGIKSVKIHLRRMVGDVTLTVEELQTLLAQIEGVLNNRPLYSAGPEFHDVLTPAHYLVGTQMVQLPQPEIGDAPYNRLTHWQVIQKFLQILWKRWYNEYINSLQQRGKWKQDEPNLKVDQIVLIKEDNPLLNCWKMGRVTQLHPGADGKVRLVTLQTIDGTVQRVVHKLCPLPVN